MYFILVIHQPVLQTGIINASWIVNYPSQEPRRPGVTNQIWMLKKKEKMTIGKIN